jgi:glycosyltransferase involved in cell wall biosynthesis
MLCLYLQSYQFWLLKEILFIMRNRKIVSIVGTVGLPAKYGGWETLVSNLTCQLKGKFYLTVFCSSVKYKDQPSEYNGAQLKYINLNANGIQSIPYDIISIYKSLNFADTILILGVSGCIFLPFVRIFGKSKIIVNIDGLEWKRDKWNGFAKWYLKLSEKIAVKYADLVVTDNKAIQQYVADEYGVVSELITYGGDHVNKESLTDNDKDQYAFLNDNYAFKVCRIEPENNLDAILEAFSFCNSLPIVIVGNWSNSAYGIELRRKYKRHQHIFMLDPIYNQKDIDVLRSNCFIYIHGHSAGGTNPSLVEAMFLELPVIAFDVSYNRETTHNKSLYFENKQQLISILEGIEKIDLEGISQSMKSIADQEYIWSVIADKYANIF